MRNQLQWIPTPVPNFSGSLIAAQQARKGITNSLSNLGSVFDEWADRRKTKRSTDAAMEIMGGADFNDVMKSGQGYDLDTVFKAVKRRNEQDQFSQTQTTKQNTSDIVARMMGREDLVGQPFNSKEVSGFYDTLNDNDRQKIWTDATIDNMQGTSTRAQTRLEADLQNIAADNKRADRKETRLSQEAGKKAEKGDALTPYQQQSLVNTVHKGVMKWMDDNPDKSAVEYLKTLPVNQRNLYLSSLDPDQFDTLASHGEYTQPVDWGFDKKVPAGEVSGAKDWLTEQYNAVTSNTGGQGAGPGQGAGQGQEQGESNQPAQPAQQESDDLDVYLDSLTPSAMETAQKAIAELRRRGITDEAQLFRLTQKAVDLESAGGK